MSCFLKILMAILLISASSHVMYSDAYVVDNEGIKTVVYLSPKFVMGPGSVIHRNYYNIDFPKGHIALKSFNAEVIDGAGNPVPLHETYLHHWLLVRYYQRSNTQMPRHNNDFKLHGSDISIVRNNGLCDGDDLGQYFGLGSETRKTSTEVPDPYGIEIGNPADIPPGYEERWLLNVHAIDTRGVEDKMGCSACRRDLYNVTRDVYGRPLPSDYIGGLKCCYDNTQCKVKEGFQGPRRGLYMRYTVKWVDWDDSLVPVKIYILDVTDTWNPTAGRAKHSCQTEYNVESCSCRSNMIDDTCADVKRTTLSIPTDGHVIYAVAHQHSGGIGSALYGEGTMSCFLKILMAILLISASSHVMYSDAYVVDNEGIKTVVYLSPKFVMGPGSVIHRNYYNIDFPKGHIALKSFNAEVIDGAGNPVPLHETYLHHWLLVRYYQRSNTQMPRHNNDFKLHGSDISIVRNNGLCDGDDLGQYFGLGSETRKTSTEVPDPYGIEIGNPADIPPGYEERWLLNVHAIDTRGVEDKMGCSACRRDLYNVTRDVYGRPLPSDYIGGLKCCYDNTQCKVKEGFQGPRRGLYMRYTVKWVDWDDSLVPVKIYILDVTDTWNPTAGRAKHSCQTEYNVESCSCRSNMIDDTCADVKRTTLSIPTDGHVIYAVAHQHSGGIGSALYGEDERVICTSMPIYGEGKEPGNERGYIVGMSTCYPQPGSVKIRGGEQLVLESNYSSIEEHTGVMGLFYILIAEQPETTSSLSHHAMRMLHRLNLSTWSLAFLALAIVIIIGFVYRVRDRTVDSSYQAISA